MVPLRRAGSRLGGASCPKNHQELDVGKEGNTGFLLRKINRMMQPSARPLPSPDSLCNTHATSTWFLDDNHESNHSKVENPYSLEP